MLDTWTLCAEDRWILPESAKAQALEMILLGYTVHCIGNPGRDDRSDETAILGLCYIDADNEGKVYPVIFWNSKEY